jgi:hypothetical protein
MSAFTFHYATMPTLASWGMKRRIHTKDKLSPKLAILFPENSADNPNKSSTTWNYPAR